MLRKMACLVIVVCVGGLVTAQTKDKGKDTPAAKEIKAKLVSVDVKKRMLTVEIDGKKKDLMVEKDTKFVGPKNGLSKAGIKDDRLTSGAMLGLTMDGAKLKQVKLPIRTTKKPAVKDKVKDK